MNTSAVETVEDLIIYDWRGTNSKGEARGGRGTIGRTVALWTERKFWLGWRTLEVRRVGQSDIVAFIGEHGEGGRTWWAEESVTHGPDPATWFLAGRWPTCQCGFAPRDNGLLNAHWRERGFEVVDDHGHLVKRPVS